MARSKEEFGNLISSVKPIADVAIAKFGDTRFIYFENHRKLTIELKYVQSLKEGKIHSINLKLYKGTFIMVKEEFESIREMILMKQDESFIVARNDGFTVGENIPEGILFLKNLISEFVQRCSVSNN
jgi:hypothetical protein